MQNQNEHVKWPNNYKNMTVAFEQRCGFPGVIGVIDGTHIPLVGVGKDRASFINRKGFLNLQLQATCTSDLKFTDLVCGWPGSVHDARVFRCSPLANMLLNLPQHKHIVGDSTYPLNISDCAIQGQWPSDWCSKKTEQKTQFHTSRY